MPADPASLPSRLQAALGDAYRIERELPAGGMSRLFLASEASLNRRVVIKVLPPEMASEVSAARFKQEMELAAQLQHPHVLPILVSGARDDLLYYVMPYVAGESLRHRLRTQGALPVRDAVRVLREIADALALAHRKGILHRDIKPENILLEEGHAVLGDFGVARALVEAHGGALTGTGLAVGTPAYMAPEQMAGDANVDGRADIYALALVGYEMLTGKPPFVGDSAQASLTARLTEVAPTLHTLRADVPPAVSGAIARALAKDPGDRFQTAGEFRDALDDYSTDPSVRVARPRRRALLAGALAIAALAVVWAATHHGSGPPVLHENVIAVAPFDVLDPALSLWHEGIVDVLSRNLDGAGPLRTVPPSVVIRRWHGRGDAASARALGENTGARYAVFGGLIRTGGDSVRAIASLLDVSTGLVIGDIERHDVADRMDRLSDSITVALIREIGTVRDLGPLQLSSVGTASLPALKAFLQGEQFMRRSAWDSSEAAFERAFTFDSTFALAYRGMAQSLGWESGSDPRVSRYQQRAAHFNHGLAPRDSILITSDSLWVALRKGPGGPGKLGGPAGASGALFSTLADGTSRYPDDPEMWFALGDARYHWGPTAAIRITARDVLDAFNRAIALDSSFTPAYIHAIELGFDLGGPTLGRRYASAYLSHGATDVNAQGARIALALTDPARRHDRVQPMLDTASADALYWAATALSRLPDSAESAVRLVRMAPGHRVIQAGYGDTSNQSAMLASALARRGHLRAAFQARRDYEELPAFGLFGAIPADTIDQVVAGWMSGEHACPPCALDWFAFRGDTAALLRAARVVDTVSNLPPGVRAWARGDIRAHLPLARGDTAAALAAFAALPDSLCIDCTRFVRLLHAVLLERTKHYREADTLLSQWRQEGGLGAVITDLERARVAEQLGDHDRAIENYERVMASWSRGDSALQPFVAESRAAIERLGKDRKKATVF